MNRGNSNSGVFVDLHAIVAATRFRRNDDDAVWIKPKLDDDGEFLVSLAELRAALKALGYNRVDVWPDLEPRG